MRTLFGLSQDENEAHALLNLLFKDGFTKDEVSIVTKTSADELATLQSSEDAEVRALADQVAHGSAVVVVRAGEAHAEKARQILTQHGALLREGPWSVNTSQKDLKIRTHELHDGEYVLPVVEESLEIGKRPVERSRVRIFSRVSERPVEESISLRSEKVHVLRRVASRNVTDADKNLFLDDAFEILEMSEEAFVNKVARVVEEIVLTKEVVEEVKTIRDTVRRSDFQIEQIAAFTVKPELEKEFLAYYDHDLAWTQRPYNEFQPAFRFGVESAEAHKGQNRSWQAIEGDVRKTWEALHPGSWEVVHAAVRHAYEKARS